MASLKISALLGLAFLALASARADEKPLPPQVQRLDGVLAPVPSEIFRTLDQFKDSNWQAVLRPDLAALKPRGTPPRIALSLGLVVGEGFIAIAANDAAEVQELGRTTLNLARALGVEKSVLRRGKSIIEHAERNELAAVRQEWSGVNADLKQAMGQIGSDPLTHLVTLGGWLRGVDALSALIAQHYSAQDARLLYQPVLLESFEKRLSEMNAKTRLDPVVVEMEKGLTALRPLIGRAHPAPLSEPEVKKVRKMAGDLVRYIDLGNP